MVIFASSAEFERQIERIHHLLETEGSEVTWNDRIPDPDNPTQLRQIDIAIRRDDCLTLVECRIHKAPQDVTWIEELIGRRISLRADAVIAVSASGFTSGAIVKASQHGIILRNLDELTEPEVRDWGKKRKFNVIFYEFSDAVVTFRLAESSLATPVVISDASGGPIKWRGLFEAAMRRLDETQFWKQKSDETGTRFEAELFAPITINGNAPASMKLGASARRIVREVSLASVVVYADPAGPALTNHALVGRYQLGASEIIEASDNVLVVVDLSQIEIPPNSLFNSVWFDFGRIVTVTKFQTIGMSDGMAYKNHVSFRFEFLGSANE